MAQTPNLGLDEVPQGLVRFDQAITRNAKILDALFDGSSSTVLGLGDKNRSIISLRPLGVERVKLDHAKAWMEMVSTGLKVGSFGGTPENGVIRLNGTDIEGYAGGIWKSLTSGGGGGSLTGGGTAGKPAEWNTTTDLGNAAAATFKQLLNIGSGARTVYTVPAGKKALVLGLKWMAEATAVTVNFVPSGGAVGLTNQVCTGAWTANNNSSAYLITALLDEGDFIHVDSGGTSINFFASVAEYSTTLFTWLKPITALNLPTTLTTIYTVPAGKVAYVPRTVDLGGLLRAAQLTDQLWIHNHSTSTQQMKLLVNDGAGDQLFKDSSSVGQNVCTRLFEQRPILMKAGDVLKFRTTLATGMNAWGVLAEVDA